MDGLLAGSEVAGTVSTETTGGWGNNKRRGSAWLAEVFGARDSDASLNVEWFVVVGVIISRGLLAEWDGPSIFVAAGRLVELVRLFEEIELRMAGKFGMVGDPDVVGALK